MPAVLPPPDLALAAQLAALLEASAPKPGNVDPTHDFGDTRYEHFLRSALAIGPALGDAGAAGVGPTVLRAVHDTRKVVSGNTNLGIVLLFAPLACAAARGDGPLRTRLAGVLGGLTVADAEAVYAAIRLAQPGGLGEAPEQDVRAAPTVTLREAMALAASWDAIAREYGSDYAITFEVGVPALALASAAGLGMRAAALEAFLAILAQVPDTLVARKRGDDVAREVSRRAAAVASLTPGTPERAHALLALDASLRDPGNSLNPGTTADLTAACLFVELLEQGLRATE